MMKYEKPIIQINSEIAEGVYAASGSVVQEKKCESEAMVGEFKLPTYVEGSSYKNYYGCVGCRAYRGPEYGGYCALSEYQWESYQSNVGYLSPGWERGADGWMAKHDGDDIVDWNQLQ